MLDGKRLKIVAEIIELFQKHKLTKGDEMDIASDLKNLLTYRMIIECLEADGLLLRKKES